MHTSLTHDVPPAVSAGAVRRFLPPVLFGLTGLGFLAAGLPKILGDTQMVEGFAKMGVPRAGLALLGALELAGAVGLFLKPTRVAAVIGLASILFGAIATHIASGMPVATVAMPVALLGLMGAGLALDPALRFELIRGKNVSGIRRVATVGLSVLMAAQFLMAGGMKALGTPDMVANMGRVHFGPLFVHTLGVFELAGAIGLLLPRFRTLAALGLVAIMNGAVAVHLVEGFVPKGFIALAVLALLWIVVLLDGRLKVEHRT